MDFAPLNITVVWTLSKCASWYRFLFDEDNVWYLNLIVDDCVEKGVAVLYTFVLKLNSWSGDILSMKSLRFFNGSPGNLLI
jgi:endo-1,4-beta-mannosidase